jgi:hypothetical protein
VLHAEAAAPTVLAALVQMPLLTVPRCLFPCLPQCPAFAVWSLPNLSMCRLATPPVSVWQAQEGLHYTVDCGKDLFTSTTQNWGAWLAAGGATQFCGEAACDMAAVTS